MPGVQKNTSFPLWSKIRKPSGFCGIFKVSKSDLADAGLATEVNRAPKSINERLEQLEKDS
jgi:hypothetical protein